MKSSYMKTTSPFSRSYRGRHCFFEKKNTETDWMKDDFTYNNLILFDKKEFN